jgi:hypothetical protein
VTDQAQSISPQKFILPPYRAFQVTRINPLFGIAPDEKPFTVEIVVSHLVQYAGKAQVLLFLDFVISPHVGGPEQKLTAMINGYHDLREVALPPPPSRLVV